MDRKAFTLIELLMVVLIMGMLGTVSLGAYRAIQRGVEERGVMENVNHFIRAAYRRAQMDRSPTAVFYWNETLRAETDTDPLIVVGRAVAVRRAGRVSRFISPFIFAEFADLDRERLIVDSSDYENDNDNSGNKGSSNAVPLYKMNSKSGSGRAVVVGTTKNVTGDNKDLLVTVGETREIPCYAYVIKDKGTAGDWHVGDAYGIEFAEIQLPHGYIFGSSYNKDTSSEPKIGQPLWFDVGDGQSGKLEVFSLRPGKSGALEALSVGTTDKPTEGVH